MHRELIHVPLIISGPGVPHGLRVAGPVQLSDVFPTILSLASVSKPSVIDGLDLVPAWTSQSYPPGDRTVFAEADHNREVGDDTLRMIQKGRYKLIFEPSASTSWLYDLETDPGELRDLSSERPAVVESLLAELKALEGRQLEGVTPPPLTDDEIDELRSLGYIQ
jgi:arylsulfatase A-like enzyme